ncbi:MAG: shikimate dehydrogenase [Propionibacteriaceae bacterium]|nr:shikimate dehydrogenase [Propionibacteriaceae bacterium]
MSDVARTVGPPAPEQRRCAVLGFPIEHSLSPALHTAAYAELGLTDWSYHRYAVDRGGLAEFVDACDGSWRGFSMTMPLKDEALELGEVSPAAALTGAANTLIFAGDRIVVHNTDIEGFWRPLIAHFRVASAADVPVASAVILGGGATARSAFAALVSMGVGEITVCARTRSKVEAWAPMFDTTGVVPRVVDFAEVPESDLLIATATKGAADPLAERIASSQRIVFDAIYDPWPTELGRAATAAGRIVFSGLDLLVAQAIAQVELMTGRTVAPEVLMTAGRAALAAR